MAQIPSEQYSEVRISGNKCECFNDTEHANMTKKSFSLIISHCTEDLSWVEVYFTPMCIERRVSIHIYEKCGDYVQGAAILLRRQACHGEQTSLPNVGREGHTYLHHMLTRSCCLSHINFFVQGSLETCPHHMSQALHQVSHFLNSTQHNPTLFRKGLWLNTRIGKCPQFPRAWVKGPRVFYENILCDWFFKITGTRKNCLNFQASYRGEFLATRGAVTRLLLTKHDVITELYHAMQTEDKSLMGYFLEMLWPVLFDSIEPCKGEGDIIMVAFMYWCHHNGISFFHKFLEPFWIDQVKTPFRNDPDAIENHSLAF